MTRSDVAWHDQGCESWTGEDLGGDPVTFPCSCGWVEWIAVDRRETHEAALPDVQTLARILMNTDAVPMPEGWPGYCDWAAAILANLKEPPK